MTNWFWQAQDFNVNDGKSIDGDDPTKMGCRLCGQVGYRLYHHPDGFDFALCAWHVQERNESAAAREAKRERIRKMD